MPTPQHPRDPHHPDFPHGTAKGGQYGCMGACPATPTCGDKRREQLRYAKYRRQSGVGSCASPAAVARARRHITSMLDQVPGMSVYGLALDLDLPLNTLLRLVEGHDRFTWKVIAAVLAASLSTTAAPAKVPIGRTRHVARTLQAQGWTLRWQSEQIGASPTYLASLNRAALNQQTAERRFADALEALAQRIGDTDATPRPGLTAAAITHAKQFAAAHGHYPQRFYDEAGVLIERAIPEHPWSVADAAAAVRIDVARASIATDPAPLAEVAATVGISKDRVQIIRDVLGLRFGYTAHGDPQRLTASSAPAAAAIRRILDDYDAGDDPIVTVLRLDALVDRAKRRRLIPSRCIPADHPGLAAYREWARTAHADRAA